MLPRRVGDKSLQGREAVKVTPRRCRRNDVLRGEFRDAVIKGTEKFSAARSGFETRCRASACTD